MGEWSKKIGEYGEDVVEKFLSIIGWHEPVKGITIPCSMQNGEHKNDRGESVKTHGIDFMYSYMNPLIDNQLNNVIISSKYSMEKYPNSPTQKFKWFMTDLINTMQCFGCSGKKTEISEQYSCSSINDIGVLFWLNGAKNSNDDLISSLLTPFPKISGVLLTICSPHAEKFCFHVFVMEFEKQANSSFVLIVHLLFLEDFLL